MPNPTAKGVDKVDSVHPYTHTPPETGTQNPCKERKNPPLRIARGAYGGGHVHPVHPPAARITLDQVHERRCPLLRRAYDIQEARRAGIHPDDLDQHLDYLWAYDQRQRLRELQETRATARRAQLDADLAAYFT